MITARLELMICNGIHWKCSTLRIIKLKPITSASFIDTKDCLDGMPPNTDSAPNREKAGESSRVDSPSAFTSICTTMSSK